MFKLRFSVLKCYSSVMWKCLFVSLKSATGFMAFFHRLRLRKISCNFIFDPLAQVFVFFFLRNWHKCSCYLDLMSSESHLHGSGLC